MSSSSSSRHYPNPFLYDSLPSSLRPFASLPSPTSSLTSILNDIKTFIQSNQNASYSHYCIVDDYDVDGDVAREKRNIMDCVVYQYFHPTGDSPSVSSSSTTTSLSSPPSNNVNVTVSQDLSPPPFPLDLDFPLILLRCPHIPYLLSQFPSHDYSIYEGINGLSLSSFYSQDYELSFTLSFSSYLSFLSSSHSSITRYNKPWDDPPSFLTGSISSLAILSAVVSKVKFMYGKDVTPWKESIIKLMISRWEKIKNDILEGKLSDKIKKKSKENKGQYIEENTQNTDPSSEVLYGVAGMIMAFLFTYKYAFDDIKEEISQSSSSSSSSSPSSSPSLSLHSSLTDCIISLVSLLFDRGVSYHHPHFPLMYTWHRSEYLGAAHGVLGILYIIMQIPVEIMKKVPIPEKINSELVESLCYSSTHSLSLLSLPSPFPTFPLLLSSFLSLTLLRTPSGNLPSSLGTKHPDVYHQWCHGSLAFLLSLVQWGEYMRRVVKDFGDQRSKDSDIDNCSLNGSNKKDDDKSADINMKGVETKNENGLKNKEKDKDKKNFHITQLWSDQISHWDEMSIQCGNLLWEKGILRKGVGLCHGISGNILGFLKLSHYHLDHTRHSKNDKEKNTNPISAMSLQFAFSFMGIIMRSEYGEKLGSFAEAKYSLFNGWMGMVEMGKELIREMERELQMENEKGKREEIRFIGYDI